MYRLQVEWAIPGLFLYFRIFNTVDLNYMFYWYTNLPMTGFKVQIFLVMKALSTEPYKDFHQGWIVGSNDPLFGRSLIVI